MLRALGFRVWSLGLTVGLGVQSYRGRIGGIKEIHMEKKTKHDMETYCSGFKV